MSVSDRIIRRREELGLNQTELANRAGLKPPAISQYESGSRSPSYEAIIKLSSALGVTTDYLISGSELKSDLISEKTARVLFNIIKDMTLENREKLVQYAIFLANQQSLRNDIPILSEASEYADYLYNNFSTNTLPVDVYDIASKLGISVCEGDLNQEGEGMLIKSEDKCFVVIDKKMEHTQRKRFTLSMLLGHGIIPWHLKTSYTIRKKGTSTLHTDETHDMEAQRFAAYLMMPQIHFIKDINKDRVSLEKVKEFASKYDVSVTSFLIQMVDVMKEKYAFVQSENRAFKTAYQGNRPLTDIFPIKSYAFSFFENPSQVEEIRSGEVPATYWFTNAEQDEVVYEESMFNPKYNGVLTLISRCN